MAKRGGGSNSDDLEIVSIGTIYSGAWDKKYWSSSRGKDRHPYPVGYQALRTHSGHTYKMEILEGAKGPIFQITSSDKQTGSGDSPDRAWDNFQKNCSSRIKLWHGKRLSSKVAGVEFFGLKNVVVQRLLRELVATTNSASNHASLITTINEVSQMSRDSEPLLMDNYPESVISLEKPRVTGKRSGTCRDGEPNSTIKKRSKSRQPSNQADVINDPCSTPSHCCINEPMIASTASDHYEVRRSHEKLLISSHPELGESTSLSGHGLPVKLPVLDSELSVTDRGACMGCVGTCSLASPVNGNFPQERKSLDRQSKEVQELRFCETIKEENERPAIVPGVLDSSSLVSKDSQVNQFSDLWAPDTFETQQEMTHLPNSGRGKGEYSTPSNAIVAEPVFSDETNAGAHTKEGSYYMNSSSEKSDFDSVGDDDIAKSMLRILLPRAVPLLMYPSRKKKRKAKPTDLTFGPTSDNQPKGATPSVDAIAPASTHAQSGNGEEKVQSARHMSEIFRCIVPDSLDNDQCDDQAANRISESANSTQVATVEFQEIIGSQRKSLTLSPLAAELSNHDNEINKCRENCCDEELLKDIKTRTQKECNFAPHSTVGHTSAIQPNPLVSAKGQSSSADTNLVLFELSSGSSEIETIPDNEDKSTSDCKGISFVSVSQKQSLSLPKMGDHSAHFSESIICRNKRDNCLPAVAHEGKLVRHVSLAKDVDAQEDLAQSCSLQGFQEKALRCDYNNDAKESVDILRLDVGDPKIYVSKDNTPDLNRASTCQSSDTPHKGEGDLQSCVPCPLECKNVDYLEKYASCGEKEGNMKLIGTYSHPMQISSVILTERTEEIYLCVSCGRAEERERDLILYKLSTKEPTSGSPFMLGQTSISLPSLVDEHGKEIAIDISGIQFTTDARGLVLTDSIKMPFCREKSLHCLCPQCGSSCLEGNAVKIVQVQHGYALLTLKLNTYYPVHCILVCGPRIIAVDESGRIYIWTMDSSWSVHTEEYVIVSHDFLPSRIVELKKVPNSVNVVIGHNGYGEFSLWDIDEHTLLSQFSAPASSVLQFLPVYLFSWQNECMSLNKLSKEECVMKLVEGNKQCFSAQTEANISCPMKGEDVALWIFIYSSDSIAQPASLSRDYDQNSDGCWRLSLLVKSKVIHGASLPTSTAAVGTSSGCGIIGTHRGQVHTWELATGNKVRTLHDLEGKRVTHVAVNDSTSSVVAVAHDGGQLLVYAQR